MNRFDVPNAPIIETTLSKDMMDYLWSQIAVARKDKFNASDRLVGHITSSLELPDHEQKFAPYIINLAKELSLMDAQVQKDIYYEIGSIWVNFQNKLEFNPIHSHTGAISFVIWMKIPYKWEDECETIPAQGIAESPLSGCFQFIYNDILGFIRTYDYKLGPSLEGTLLVFPSQLKHTVYPFYTSDEERISISGNIF